MSVYIELKNPDGIESWQVENERIEGKSFDMSRRIFAGLRSRLAVDTAERNGAVMLGRLNATRLCVYILDCSEIQLPEVSRNRNLYRREYQRFN